ncbi:protease complex subunit PrcB family protein [Deinococcus malanensis]|nr:protease complex subunit PrcB family protein [Deinococcus malanensis]
MNKTLFLALGFSAGLLSACSMTGPSNLRVHEVLLYGGTQERITWVYGNLSGGPSSLRIGGATTEVRAQVQDPLALPGTLSVNGGATYRAPTTRMEQKLSVTRGTDGLFTVVQNMAVPVRALYYTDGRSWQKLSGTSGVVRAETVQGLRGAGRLTDAEGTVLATALQGQGPLAVAVLDETRVPDAALAVEPRPTEYLRTALYILPGVVTLARSAPAVPAPTQPAPTQPAPTPPASSAPSTGARVNITEVAQGNNATVTSFSVQVATTQAAASALYAQAYGRQTSPPSPPSVAGGTLVGVFLGQRTTGGYAVRVTGASASAGTLTLTVRVTAPGPDSITTQAITSPWAIVRVPGTFTRVNVVDEQGRPLSDQSGGGQSR